MCFKSGLILFIRDINMLFYNCNFTLLVILLSFVIAITCGWSVECERKSTILFCKEKHITVFKHFVKHGKNWLVWCRWACSLELVEPVNISQMCEHILISKRSFTDCDIKMDAQSSQPYMLIFIDVEQLIITDPRLILGEMVAESWRNPIQLIVSSLDRCSPQSS